MKIISGGQTGVDQAALRAAKEQGLHTGGYAPKGYKTLSGPAPWLEHEYGLEEYQSESYRLRTGANVIHSDATLQIAHTFQSKGELCTFYYIKIHEKPYIQVLFPLGSISFDIQIKRIMHWLGLVKPVILNVAGNSESTAPGIYKEAYIFLTELFRLVKEQQDVYENTNSS